MTNNRFFGFLVNTGISKIDHQAANPEQQNCGNTISKSREITPTPSYANRLAPEDKPAFTIRHDLSGSDFRASSLVRDETQEWQFAPRRFCVALYY